MHPLVSFLANILTHCLFPTRSVPSALTATGGLTEGSVMREHPVRVREEAGEEKGRRRCLHILRKVVARCFLPDTSGSSALTRIDALTEGSVMGEPSVRAEEEYGEEKGQRGSLQVSTTSSPDAYFLLLLGCQL
jgi:hypothetical protein